MVGVCLAGALAFLNLHATQPLLPFLCHVFHATKASAGMTVSAPALAIALSAPFIGAIADCLGRKRIIVPSIFGVGMLTFMAATSSTLIDLTVWRFIQGLILPAVFAISMTYVTEEWKKSEVGSAMAMYVSGNVLGGFSGRFISGIAADTFGWRMAFVTLGVCTVVGGMLVWWLLPASRQLRQRDEDTQVLSALPQHLKNSKLVITFIVGATLLFSIVAVFTYINYHLAAPPFMFSTVGLSTVFVVYLFGAMVTPFAGKLIDKIGFRRAYAMAVALSLAGLLLTLSQQIEMIVVGLAVFCSGIFVGQSSTTSSLRVFAPHNRSAAAGLYVCLYYLGGSLGGYLPSLVWDLGQWKACVMLVAVVLFASVVFAWFFWKPARTAAG